jgi:hypothetical protein
MNRWNVGLLILALVMTGCAKPAEEPVEVEEVAVVEWEKVLAGSMTDTQKAQQELVATAVNALASEMMGELTAALDAGDPSAAIAVCKEKAPSVAARVHESYGVTLGRTSHRLRNAANVAPEWAQSYVDDMAEDPTYLVGPNGELGALLPIKLRDRRKHHGRDHRGLSGRPGSRLRRRRSPWLVLGRGAPWRGRTR